LCPVLTAVGRDIDLLDCGRVSEASARYLVVPGAVEWRADVAEVDAPRRVDARRYRRCALAVVVWRALDIGASVAASVVCVARGRGTVGERSARQLVGIVVGVDYPARGRVLNAQKAACNN
jgi:hypothetical protein